MKSRFAAAIAAAAVIALLVAPSAFAATQVGNECAGNEANEDVTVFGATNPPGSLPAAVPVAGVITKWTLKIGKASSEIPDGEIVQGNLKVLRPTGPTGGTIVGESALATLSISSSADAATTSATRIPVQAGDRLGDRLTVSRGGRTESAGYFCGEQSPSSTVVGVEGAAPLGSQVGYVENGENKVEVEKFGVPIVVTVEPDADGDGYGDETQDLCPTNATTQAACPATPSPAAQPQPSPPASKPPVVLGAVSVAGKGAVDVYVTAGGSTTATVSGSTKLGKKKTVALSGGSQAVGAGSLTKFRVKLPARVKTRLRHLPAKRTLTVSLAVSAPDAARAVPWIVKLHGGAKSAAHKK